MYTLVLKNRQAIDARHVGFVDDRLSIEAAGLTMLDAVRIFADPECTECIICQHGSTETVYEGYTILNRVSAQDDSVIVLLEQM